LSAYAVDSVGIKFLKDTFQGSAKDMLKSHPLVMELITKVELVEHSVVEA